MFVNGPTQNNSLTFNGSMSKKTFKLVEKVAKNELSDLNSLYANKKIDYDKYSYKSGVVIQTVDKMLSKLVYMANRYDNIKIFTQSKTYMDYLPDIRKNRLFRKKDIVLKNPITKDKDILPISNTKIPKPKYEVNAFVNLFRQYQRLSNFDAEKNLALTPIIQNSRKADKLHERSENIVSRLRKLVVLAHPMDVPAVKH